MTISILCPQINQGEQSFCGHVVKITYRWFYPESEKTSKGFVFKSRNPRYCLIKSTASLSKRLQYDSNAFFSQSENQNKPINPCSFLIQIKIIPCLMNGTIFDSPLFVTLGIARMGLPSPSWLNAAPLRKSICPPTPAKTYFSGFT